MLRKFGSSIFISTFFVLAFLFSTNFAIAKSLAPPTERNIAYGNDELQSFDVYFAHPRNNAPVIFMVHGGAWFKGDKSSRGVVAAKQRFWNAKGFTFVSTNYRLMPEASPLDQASDVAKAIAKAQEFIRVRGGGSGPFFIMGHSSGAHLVALLAADPTIATSRGASLWAGAILIDTAALDIPKIMNNPHARFYDWAFEGSEQSQLAASPLHRLKAPAPPILAICSTRRAKPCPRAKSFARQAKKVGTSVTILPVDKSHRQLNRQLGEPGAYTRKVDSFIQGHKN